MQKFRSQQYYHDQQDTVDLFQKKCLDSLYNDPAARKDLVELLKRAQPIDGVIKVISVTKSYMKYMRAQGQKLTKNKPVICYQSYNEFKKDNITSNNIMEHYEKLNLEEKKNQLFFVFQVPISNNPSRSRQNIAIITDLNLDLS